jgi:hypothetical protein
VARGGRGATTPCDDRQANTASDYYDGWTWWGFRLALWQPWAMGLATSAAQNRNTNRPAQLGAAPPEVMEFRPFRICPVQPGPRGCAVVLRLDPPLDARRFLAAIQYQGPVRVGEGAGAAHRGLV